MHKLLTDKPGKEMLLLGNEAIARGALEAGVSFATCYPGTPSSEIPEQFFHISQETDLYFEYSTNEKVAMEVGAAAAISGQSIPPQQKKRIIIMYFFLLLKTKLDNPQPFRIALIICKCLKCLK